MKRIKVGILGATGSVGQRFIQLLAGHPWFEIIAVAASHRSAGKKYHDVIADRWKLSTPIPDAVAQMKVQDVACDEKKIAADVDLIFSTLDADKKMIQQIENSYAADGVAVVSNNSAHRWSEDVPVIIPEINPHHLQLIDIQRKNRGWKKGLIAVKPNCSIQSYVAVLTALWEFQPTQVVITSLQAISGAGKTFSDWPEMVDNVIPFISGEEEKSEKEPLKIWGTIKNGTIENATIPQISATCIRVPVTDGHMVSVSVKFAHKPLREDIISMVTSYQSPIADLQLPSAPVPFISYFEDENRPQTKIDRELGKGMGISMGRLRQDSQYDFKFIALSHNTIRGAAGGAILTAELLYKKGYIRTS